MNSLFSQRLAFRILTGDDVSERYVGWLNDPEVNQFLETRFVRQTLETCMTFVTDMERDPNSHLFGIFERDPWRHVGNIKLGFISTHHRTGQLSLLIGEKSCWGRGYATESIREITRWGFDELGLDRVEAGCYESNLGSLRAFLKAGYSVEGFFRKAVVSGGRRVGVFKLGILRDDRIE